MMHFLCCCGVVSVLLVDVWSQWRCCRLSPQPPCTQRHLGDALTKRVPNECGKWEYQFDELCYSIRAINFPVAPPSKMESRMMEPLLRYLILFLGELPACRCVSGSVCQETARGREIFKRSLILFVSGKRNCVLACSLHKTGSSPYLF